MNVLVLLASLHFAFVVPDSGNIGTCRRPIKVALPAGKVMVHWRLWNMGPPYPYVYNDSILANPRDTISRDYTIRREQYVLLTHWPSRTGWNNGPVKLYGCTTGKILIPKP